VPRRNETRDLRSGVMALRNVIALEVSPFARFSGSFDFRLLQHYLPQKEVKRQAITSTTLNDIVQSLLDEVSDYRHCTFGCIGDCRRQENCSNRTRCGGSAATMSR